MALAGRILFHLFVNNVGFAQFVFAKHCPVEAFIVQSTRKTFREGFGRYALAVGFLKLVTLVTK